MHPCKPCTQWLMLLLGRGWSVSWSPLAAVHLHGALPAFLLRAVLGSAAKELARRRTVLHQLSDLLLLTS